MNLFVFVACVAFSGYAFACDLDPQYWCDNVEIARNCNVYEQCKSRLYPDLDLTRVVNVTVYYESLCPDSIRFIRQQLYPTWMKLKDTGILNIRVVPYGKAMTYNNHGRYSFVCQHGKDECYGNKIENCIMEYSNYNAEIYFPVIHCISTEPAEVIGNVEKCINDEESLDYAQIMECADGVEGSELKMVSGAETLPLEPALYWVPWININDMHSDEMQTQAEREDLKKLVCDTYTSTLPDECALVYLRDDALDKIHTPDQIGP